MAELSVDRELQGRFEFAPDRDGERSSIELWHMAVRYKWLLVLGGICGLILGQLAYWQLGPVYEAYTRILVSRTATTPIKDVESQALEGRSEHITLIMSPMIVDQAVKKHHLDELPSLYYQPDPTETIVESLKVKRSAGEDRSFLNVFDITYLSTNEADAAAITTAIIDAYQDYLQETHEEHSSQVLELITKARNELQSELKVKEEEYLAFRSTAPLTWKAPPGVKGEVTNVHQERILTIELERQKLLLLRADIQSKVKALTEAVNRGESQELLELMVRQFLLMNEGSTPGVTTQLRETAELDGQLLPLLLKEKELMRDYGPDHPDLQNVRQTIQTLVAFYRTRGIELPRETLQPGASSHRAQFNLVTIYLRSLEQQRKALQHRAEELDALYDQETELSRTYAHYHAKDLAMSEEIRRLKSLWEAVVNRLSELQLVKDEEGYNLKQISPVRSALVIKRQLKFLLAGLVGGIALALGLASLRELRDTTLRSVEDLRMRTHLPVLGAIPHFHSDEDPVPDENGIVLHPSLSYLHHPGSASAEAYRAVRTALFACLAMRKQKVFQVTSPEPGDGKSTFLSNLAIAMAQAGKSVLLIDADLRRPRIGELFGSRHDIGTVDVLEGEILLENAVQETRISGLTLLTTGKVSLNPAELLSSPRFSQMLRTARERYDMILVDSPPLLAVSDPCIVAPHSDALLLVVRLLKNQRDSLARAQELLETHGINPLGMIANDLLTAGAEAYSYGYRDRYEPKKIEPAPAKT